VFLDQRKRFEYGFLVGHGTTPLFNHCVDENSVLHDAPIFMGAWGMTWDKGLEGDLRRLWDSGMNSTLIAARLGVTRGALMGKVSRMKLRRRQRSRKSPVLNQHIPGLADFRSP